MYSAAYTVEGCDALQRHASIDRLGNAACFESAHSAAGICRPSHSRQAFTVVVDWEAVAYCWALLRFTDHASLAAAAAISTVVASTAIVDTQMFRNTDI